MTVSDISFYADRASIAIAEAADRASTPSVLYRPALYADGDTWCALLGDDLATGVAGFGKTPAEAMWAFDRAFLTLKTPAAMFAENSKPAGD